MHVVNGPFWDCKHCRSWVISAVSTCLLSTLSVLMAIFQVDLSSWYQNVSMLDFTCAKGDGGNECLSGNNWSYKTYKAPVKMSPPTNQHPVFTGRMTFLSSNQQCRSTEGKLYLLSTFISFHSCDMKSCPVSPQPAPVKAGKLNKNGNL